MVRSASDEEIEELSTPHGALGTLEGKRVFVPDAVFQLHTVH